MQLDPFDPDLLRAYEHFARRYPGLTLGRFRVLWQEADALMRAALALGFEPEDVPDLLVTDEPQRMELIPPRPGNTPPEAN
jgi:hypothetical protein